MNAAQRPGLFLPAVPIGCLALLGAVAPAAAAVGENLDTDYYEVRADTRRNLLALLNEASPIRVNGQVFHAYTSWNVRWRFYWHEQADGRCAIARTRIDLTGKMTLPRLAGSADRPQEQDFNGYVTALRTHELGHYQFGKEAARAIDQALQGLPQMASCKALERVANRSAREILDSHTARERQYDIDTGHGKTQGAWLPR